MFRGGDSAPKAPPIPVVDLPPTRQNSPSNSRIFIVYSDAEEFEFERRLLWSELFPELQSFAFHAGFDLEWVDPLSGKQKLTTEIAEKIADDLRDDGNSWIICLLGDKYGSPGPPSEIGKEEYEAIRRAVFEQNSDVKLLDQHYVLDRSREREEYRLANSVEDSKTRSKLVKVIQKGAQAAFDEGVINQVNTNRQKRFEMSPIHIIVNRALELGTRSIFLLRLFDGVRHDTGSNAIYTEKTDDAKRRIMDLKNEVSKRADEKSVFNHILIPENGDIGNLFATKEADKYRDDVTRQLTERMKSQLSSFHSNIRFGPPANIMEIAKDEDRTHNEHCREKMRKPWLSRAGLDAKISEFLANKEGGAFLIQGPDLSGKTQMLCRIFEKVPTDAHKIIRFLNISYSSVFAHETYQHVCMIMAMLYNFDYQPIQKSFKLAQFMDILELMLSKIEKPLYIFIDDVHLMKYGNFLSAIDKRIVKCPPKLYLFMTASNIGSVQSMFIISQTINVEPPNENEIIEMLRLNMSTTKRKVSSDQLSGIKLQLSGSNNNIVLAETLLDELLQRGNGTMSGGIEGRLGRIEAQLGTLPVKFVCRYLSVTFHGLTRLELYDLLSSNQDLMEKYGGGTAFLALLLDSVLESLGSLLMKVEQDHRILFRVSHIYLLNIFRHRYLLTILDLKTVHNEIVDLFGNTLRAEMDALSPRDPFIYLVFPQETKRDNTGANIRKLRNLWYHSLHTGDMDALKEMAMCQFEYVDSVVRNCGIMHLLSMYEECAMQVLHHDIQMVCEQVLLPALPTVVRDPEQLAAEVIGRLRFTRIENSHFLNTMVEQAMGWVDTTVRQPLLVPLSCWVSPPIMKSCRSFTLKDWKAANTIVTPTYNHQHVLVSGNVNTPGVIFMYHIASQIPVNSFKGHTAAVTALVSSNNGQFFISTSVDKTIKKWTFTPGEPEKTWTVHTGKVTCAILNSDDTRLITGSADSSAKVIDVETGTVLRSFNEHTGSVVSLQLTSNNQFLITGSGDFVVQMWDLNNGRCIARMGGLMAPVSCVCVTSNDAFVAVGCEDETLRVYSTVSGTELHELMGHEGKVNALAAAQDDCQLFAATKSKIYCYDIHNGQILDILDCQQAFPVCGLKITADNFFLISGCGPRVHVWNIHKRVHDVHDVASDKEGFLTSITVSPDEKWAACGTYNGIVGLWDLEVCQVNSNVVHSQGVPVSCISFSTNNVFLLSGNAIGNIIILEVASMNPIRDVNHHSSEIVSICNMENMKVYSCCKEGKLATWNLLDDEDGVETITHGVAPPIFTPPHGRIMIAHCPNNAKEMRVWNLTEQGFVQKNRLYHNEEITCFAASTHGALVATGSTDQSVKLWQIESGYLTQVLVGHEDAVTCVAMAEDERIVVSGAKDHKVIIWRVATGDIAYTLTSLAPVTSVALTSDASVAFCGMEDGWLEAYSTERGRLLSSLNNHRPVRNIISLTDASRLVLHLSGCAQLPILCLHNTPAVSVENRQRKRSSRTQSITSLGNNDSAGPPGEVKKDPPTTMSLQAGNGGNRAGNPRPTFDKLERSKSRTSLIEKPKCSSSWLFVLFRPLLPAHHMHNSTAMTDRMEDGWLEAYSTERGRLLSSLNNHRPVRNIISLTDASRLVLHLSGCAQLPILCLHNTPAVSVENRQRKRSSRTQSITSLGNNDSAGPPGEVKKDPPTTMSLQAGNGGNRAGNPRPTFDKLERSKSRTSLIEKDRATTLTTVTVPVVKSNMCSIL